MSPKSDTNRLVLIDAHAVLHRAYHALPQFSNSKGEPTGGLYGLAAMLIKIIKDLRPDYIAAAYDLPKPTFRHEAYKEYKAGRAKADDALVSQMIRSRELFLAFGIPIYDKEGFEADDILGTIVHQLPTTNYQQPTTRGKKTLDSRLRGNDRKRGEVNREVETVIASGDMDTLQLVDDKKVQVYTLKKGINDTVLYDEDAVRARFGFGPELLPDYKGLCGDASDNIKGVAGIGEKTAGELVQKFGTIENLYKMLAKKREKLLEAGVKERVVGLLEKGKEDAEFSKLLATIRRDAPISFLLPEKRWSEGLKIERVDALLSELEFRGLGERLREAVNRIQDSRENGAGKQAGNEVQEKGKERAEEKPAQALFNEAAQEEAVSPNEQKETSVALWLINSAMTNPTPDDIWSFAGTREWGAAREKIFSELRSRGLSRVFEEIEKPLVPVVARMNERGVKIDAAYLGKLSKEYHRELAALEKEIHKEAGGSFNINSPKQLGEILFVKMGLKAARQKKTAGGALSTRESELLKLRDAHPIIGKILEYREFQKLLSTYIDTIPAMVAADGRLHANFLQAGASTGRMASENPNLQNIPVQTERGRRIRNSFVAEKGFLLLALDYSQIELRVAAMLSGDEKLSNIFKAGEDVHTSVAAYVFRVPRDGVTKEMRRQAKVINFGMLYGMGVTSLQHALAEGGAPVSRTDAAHFLEDYFAHFHTLAAYIEEIKAGAAERGYTETLFGRRRSFEAIHSQIPYIRAAAERQAMNAPFQGTAADIIKLAMVRVDEFLEREELRTDAFLILQVHDELVFEVREKRVQELAPKIRKIMESVISAKESRGVPILVSASIGENWGEMEKV